METGQLSMQMSSKPMADFANPVSTTAASTDVDKRDLSKFDGVLRQTAPQRSSRTEQPAKSEDKRVMPKSAEPSDELVNAKPAELSDEPVNAKSAAGLVDGSDGSGKPPDDDKLKKMSDADEKKEDVSAVKQDVSALVPEGQIPQNVEILAAGAQVVIVQQLPEGRMPQSENREESVNMAAEKVEAQNAAKTLNMPLMPDGKLVADMAGQPQNATSEAKVSATPTAAGVIKSEPLQAISGSQPLIQPEKLPETESGPAELVAAQKLVAVQKPPVLSATDSKKLSEVKTAEIPSAVNLKNDAETAQQGLKTDLKTEISSLKPDLKAGALNVLPTTAPVSPDIVAVQNAAGNLPQTEKVQQQPVAQEFRFARSSSVELAIGTGNDVVGQTKAKADALPVFEAKIAESGKTAETAQSGFSGAESGLKEKGADGLSQQHLEMPKPGTLQMTNVPLNIVDNAKVNSLSQPAAQEQLHVTGSENIAVQVREQLSTRNIKQGNEQITIQLSPDHLGDIKVNFRLEDQRLRVEIVAENRTARESLLQHADSLKESLARQNINMEKFEVTGGSNGSTTGQGGYAQPEWREMAKNRQSQQWLASGGYRTQSADLLKQAPVYFARAEQSTLDLHF